MDGGGRQAGRGLQGRPGVVDGTFQLDPIEQQLRAGEIVVETDGFKNRDHIDEMGRRAWSTRASASGRLRTPIG